MGPDPKRACTAKTLHDWRVCKIRKKLELLGHVRAATETEAIDAAAADYQTPASTGTGLSYERKTDAMRTRLSELRDSLTYDRSRLTRTLVLGAIELVAYLPPRLSIGTCPGPVHAGDRRSVSRARGPARNRCIRSRP